MHQELTTSLSLVLDFLLSTTSKHVTTSLRHSLDSQDIYLILLPYFILPYFIPCIRWPPWKFSNTQFYSLLFFSIVNEMELSNSSLSTQLKLITDSWHISFTFSIFSKCYSCHIINDFYSYLWQIIIPEIQHAGRFRNKILPETLRYGSQLDLPYTVPIL